MTSQTEAEEAEMRAEGFAVSKEDEVLVCKKEGGKSLTCLANGCDVALIVWRKNGGVLLPLVLNRMEAQRLRSMLDAAIAEACKP